MKGRVVPVHAIKAHHRGGRCVASLIPDIDTRGGEWVPLLPGNFTL